jgi:molybdate transport system substrate-binding protein
VEHVEQREKKGLLKPHSVAIYATGLLALWIPRDLVQPGIRVIALAKPELAPYGQAARESLQHPGLWNQVQSKIVYADNISMASSTAALGMRTRSSPNIGFQHIPLENAG